MFVPFRSTLAALGVAATLSAGAEAAVLNDPLLRIGDQVASASDVAYDIIITGGAGGVGFGVGFVDFDGTFATLELAGDFPADPSTGVSAELTITEASTGDLLSATVTDFEVGQGVATLRLEVIGGSAAALFPVDVAILTLVDPAFPGALSLTADSAATGSWEASLFTVTQIPLPAGAPLLLGALGLLATARRRA